MSLVCTNAFSCVRQSRAGALAAVPRAATGRRRQPRARAPADIPVLSILVRVLRAAHRADRRGAGTHARQPLPGALARRRQEGACLGLAVPHAMTWGKFHALCSGRALWMRCVAAQYLLCKCEAMFECLLGQAPVTSQVVACADAAVDPRRGAHRGAPLPAPAAPLPGPLPAARRPAGQCWRCGLGYTQGLGIGYSGLSGKLARQPTRPPCHLPHQS